MNLTCVKQCVLVLLLMSFTVHAMETDKKAPACVCSRILKPVCASNGKTYSNECMFNCLKQEEDKRIGGEKLRVIANRSCESLENL